MYQPYIDFYVPHNKEQYLTFFLTRYPNASKTKWLKITSRRLKQIYIAIRTRKG